MIFRYVYSCLNANEPAGRPACVASRINAWWMSNHDYVIRRSYDGRDSRFVIMQIVHLLFFKIKILIILFIIFFYQTLLFWDVSGVWVETALLADICPTSREHFFWPKIILLIIYLYFFVLFFVFTSVYFCRFFNGRSIFSISCE